MSGRAAYRSRNSYASKAQVHPDDPTTGFVPTRGAEPDSPGCEVASTSDADGVSIPGSTMTRKNLVVGYMLAKAPLRYVSTDIEETE
jgi:hypothetical protein